MTTHHRITAGIVALGLAASAAPASAWQSNINANGSQVPANEPALGQATPPSSSVSKPPTIVRVTVGNSGFDWGDAGIGAAGGLALSMVGLGGALAVSQHRSRRTAAP
jgi:hypothetical protein